MRVIAGTARGHVLTAPKGQTTRPTADRLKENLFNIIAPYLPQAHFLDLFCGSGAIGVEALSRGASRAVFVDTAPTAVAATQANLHKTKLAPLSRVIPTETHHALEMLRQEGARFHLVFMDPPYHLATTYALPTHFPHILEETGMLILECEAATPPPLYPGLALLRQKTYGRTQFLFYGKDRDNT